MTFQPCSFPSFRPARRPSPNLGATFALVLLFACQGTWAADPQARPAAATTPSSILTQTQLRECMTQRDRMREQTEAVLKVKTQVEAERAEIDRVSAVIAELGTTLDRTRPEDVEAYNVRVAERNSLVDAFEGRLAAYNKEAGEAIASRDNYNKACSNRRYEERDLKNIERTK